jgi:acetate kinase
MKILVLNSGSSSIKYKLFDSKNLSLLFDGIEENVKDFHKAFENIFKILIDSNTILSLEDIGGFGHRVVHGGEYFSKPTLIDNNVLAKLEKLVSLAPLHNPSNIDGIKSIYKKLPNAKQIAVFDTAFHTTMPQKISLYPLPYSLYQKHKIRKYGFHGTSHSFVANEYALYCKKNLKKLNLLTIHLGNGASICAIKKGKSIDTSMGFTPLEGLMMGTRSGSIDPAIVIYLQKYLKYSLDEVDDILNKQSGFKGICGKNDLRTIIQNANSGDKKAKLAIDMFVERIRNYIGSYIIKLGKVDAIIFTGGIGENSSFIRGKILKDMFANIGIKLNKQKNNIQDFENINTISSKKSKINLVVVKTNEEKSIAIQTKRFL